MIENENLIRYISQYSLSSRERLSNILPNKLTINILLTFNKSLEVKHILTDHDGGDSDSIHILPTVDNVSGANDGIIRI
jgi:hypothetical protein